MRKNYKFKRIISLLSILIFLISIYCYAENNWIETENIKVGINNLPKELNGLKIVHLSDLHLPKNASSINSIINKVKQQNPDIIVITGDVIDKEANIKACGLDKLCMGLSKIAKTYAVTGNHEIWNGNVFNWNKILTDNNVKVLNNEVEIFTKNNCNIAVIGLEDDSSYNPESLNGFDKIKHNKNMPIILLAHRPELLPSYSSPSQSIIPNIVFSGHAHGGQFRIPFIDKGIFAPDQGFFPKYTSGLYNFNNINMVVSRGLGNSIIPIRINDRPHLPVIEIIGSK